MNNNTENIYVKNGYKDRHDYLQSLADDFGIPYEIVQMCADMLGSSEDFDGLVISLQDEFD